MKYELYSCNLCGSDHIEKIRTEKNGEDEIVVYKCGSCGFEVKSKKKNAAEKVKTAESSETASADGSKVFKIAEKCVFPICGTSKNGHVSGSVFLVGNGYAITNAHVVITNDEYGMTLNDDLMVVINGNTLDAEMVTADIKLDLALVKVETGSIAKAALGDFERVKTGEKIFAVGNSLGSGISITDGIVSDRLRTVGGNKFIMVSAPINKGNSGGALFNAAGEIIGVVTATESVGQAMSYAVPVSDLTTFIRKIEVSEDISVF